MKFVTDNLKKIFIFKCFLRCLLVCGCLFFVFMSMNVWATNIYLDPTAKSGGDGSFAKPYDSWDDVEGRFNASNDYYQKCGTTAHISDAINITNITAKSGNRMIIGAYYAEGSFDLAGCLADSARPIIQNRGNASDIIKIANSDYVTLQNLDLREGKDTIEVSDTSSSSDYLTIEYNLIGEGCTGWGIRTLGNYTRTGWEISHNTMDTKIGTYGQIPGDTLWDGIKFIYTSNSSVHHNHIKDWGHTGIAIQSNSDNNLIYNNFFESVDGRFQPFEFYDESTSGNKLYNNYIKGTSDGSKLMGVSNEVYNNIFAFLRAIGSGHIGVAISMGSLSCCGHSYNNKFYNNTIYKTDAFAIKIADGGGTTNVTGLEIFNNLIVESGDCYSGSRFCSSDEEYPIHIQDWNANSDINNNTFKNNIIYTPGRTTDVVKYLSSKQSISQFNNMNGANGNIISGNINDDPKLKNPDKGDFSLQSDSPYKGLGIGVEEGVTVGINSILVEEDSSPTLTAPRGLKLLF